MEENCDITRPNAMITVPATLLARFVSIERLWSRPAASSAFLPKNRAHPLPKKRDVTPKKEFGKNVRRQKALFVQPVIHPVRDIGTDALPPPTQWAKCPTFCPHFPLITTNSLL
ncbi:hypothetical protein Zmor_016723 [Zophobas morio]|uniref:Uncharacterized protein n=1 Tax=Zophobas morio TaxID=2755281 RepID=A0AA38I7Y4_9CUCU|nr:hypothetical protein Zmor_016723 [Zophobas morio]